jgi:hypothetical protein
VCRHRGSGKYEAHLWDKQGWNPNQTRKRGRQGEKYKFYEPRVYYVFCS